MIRVIKTCPRCGSVASDTVYKKTDPWDIPMLADEPCENCRVEFEALKFRQEEERRLFWEGDNGED